MKHVWRGKALLQTSKENKQIKKTIRHACFGLLAERHSRKWTDFLRRLEQVFQLLADYWLLGTLQENCLNDSNHGVHNVAELPDGLQSGQLFSRAKKMWPQTVKDTDNVLQPRGVSCMRQLAKCSSFTFVQQVLWNIKAKLRDWKVSIVEYCFMHSFWSVLSISLKLLWYDQFSALSE